MMSSSLCCRWLRWASEVRRRSLRSWEYINSWSRPQVSCTPACAITHTHTRKAVHSPLDFTWLKGTFIIYTTIRDELTRYYSFQWQLKTCLRCLISHKIRCLALLKCMMYYVDILCSQNIKLSSKTSQIMMLQP